MSARHCGGRPSAALPELEVGVEGSVSGHYSGRCSINWILCGSTSIDTVITLAKTKVKLTSLIYVQVPEENGYQMMKFLSLPYQFAQDNNYEHERSKDSVSHQVQLNITSIEIYRCLLTQ